MKKYLRSPLMLMVILFCIIALSGFWLLIRSPEDPGAVNIRNPALNRLGDMTGRDGRPVEIISTSTKMQETRPAYRLSLPAELSTDIEVRDRGFLDFGVTFNWEGSDPVRRYVVCGVYADWGRGHEKLFERRWPIEKGKERWINHRVDLSGLPPGKAVLEIRMREVLQNDGALRRPLRAFLSCPLLFGGHRTEHQGNIIFYLVDTLRADHLSCYGYPRNVSPHINALAMDGVLFHALYAQSSWTAPSAATMFSSLYPSDHGLEMNEDRLSDNVEMLAEILSREGYRTKAFVANGFVSTAYNFHQGFDAYVACSGEKQDGHALGEEIVEKAAAWIKTNRDQKFFLYIHTVDPHSPYDPPEPFRSRFDRGFQSEVRGDHGPQGYRRAQNLSSTDINHLIDLYDGEISYSDACFGYLMSQLKVLGLYKDTTVILTSDHGEEFWDHNGWGHGKNLFVEQLHIPMILKFGKNRGAGTVVKSRVQSLDIVPTLLGAINVAGTSKMAGQDLYDTIFGQGTIRDRKIFSETNKGNHRLFSVMDNRYKYILRKEPVFQEALYDLRKDPLERTNIADTQEGTSKTLRRSVEGFLSENGRGYHLMFQGGGPEDVVLIEIRGIRRFRAVDILGYTGDRQESERIIAEQDMLRIRLEDLSQRREVVFFPKDEGTFCMAIHKEGGRLDPRAVHFGEKGSHPRAVPFCVDAYEIDGVTDIMGKPRIEDSETLKCYLWAKDPELEKAKPTDENIRNLRALGYLE